MDMYAPDSPAKTRFNQEIDAGMHDGLMDSVNAAGEMVGAIPSVEDVTLALEALYGGTRYTQDAIRWMIEHEYANRWM